MAITDKTEGVWNIQNAFDKNAQGGIWPQINENVLYSWGNSGFQTLRPSPSIPSDKVSSPVQVGDSSNTGWQLSKFAYRYPGGSPHRIGVHAIKTDGSLWAWGREEDGWFGVNTEATPTNSPKQIPGTWTHISNGVAVAGIKADASLWTWGDNGGDEAGNLGHNDQVQRSSPTQIPGSYKSVAAFREMAMCAVKTDGTLWGWGRQYRWGNTTLGGYTSSPTQVGTNTNWDSVDLTSAGNSCFTGLKTDGTLWVWGYGSGNNGGQNQGSPGWNTSPRQVGTDTDWVRPTVGMGANWFWKGGSTKEMWCLGGQFKKWGYLSGSVPTDVTTMSSPIQLLSTWNGANWSGDGNETNVAVKSDGTMWAQGRAVEGLFMENHANDGTEISSPIQLTSATSWQAPLIIGGTPGNGTGAWLVAKTDVGTTSGV
jgi:alpha-tubulin suppressor-like RCC1 family protein